MSVPLFEFDSLHNVSGSDVSFAPFTVCTMSGSDVSFAPFTVCTMSGSDVNVTQD